MVQTRSQKSVAAESDAHPPNKHVATPPQCCLLGAAQDLESAGVTHSKSELCRTHDSSDRTGWRLRKEQRSRRLANDPDRTETRGRRKQITEDQSSELAKMIENEGFEARALTYEQLAIAIHAEVSGCTIKREPNGPGDFRRTGCQRKSVQKSLKDLRVNWCKRVLAERPNPEDWTEIRLTAEAHFGFGDQRKSMIIRKPGERCRSDA
jgi:hypothetical protein